MFAIFPALLLLMFHAGVPAQGQSTHICRENMVHAVALVRQAAIQAQSQSRASFCAFCLGSAPSAGPSNLARKAPSCIANFSEAQALPVPPHFTGLTRDGPNS